MKQLLPTFKKDGFNLMSGIELHEANPKTFWIPSDEDKAKLKKGDMVKLIFEIRTVNQKGEEDINPERMWVIIKTRDGDWFTGKLDNQPAATDKIKLGRLITFKAEHIVDIS